jgi:hypothetical protein
MINLKVGDIIEFPEEMVVSDEHGKFIKFYVNGQKEEITMGKLRNKQLRNSENNIIPFKSLDTDYDRIQVLTGKRFRMSSQYFYIESRNTVRTLKAGKLYKKVGYTMNMSYLETL